MSGTLQLVGAVRKFRSQSGRRLGGFRTRDALMPTDCIIWNQDDIRGTTAPAIS